MPAAKPTAGVFLPPNSSIKLSYLPPPHNASCAPKTSDVSSKTVACIVILIP